MAKHNYSQYSNKNKPANHADKPVVKEKPISPAPEAKTIAVDPVVEPMIETVETVALTESVMGIVIGCAKLNIRSEPSAYADVLGVLDAASEIEIDVTNSTNEWVKICTASGLEGYCMRKYIEAQL